MFRPYWVLSDTRIGEATRSERKLSNLSYDELKSHINSANIGVQNHEFSGIAAFILAITLKILKLYTAPHFPLSIACRVPAGKS